MPYCSNCNAEVGEEATVCPECGATFGSQEHSGGLSLGDDTVRTVGIGTAGASALLLFILLALSVTRPGPLRVPWSTVVFLGVYTAATIGVWKGTWTGYTVGMAGFGLATAASTLVVFQLLGVLPPETIQWPAFDPLSLLLGVIQSVQIRSQPRSGMFVSGPTFQLLTYAGTVGIGAITGILWRRRAELPKPERDATWSGVTSPVSLSLLLAGVVSAVAAPFLQVFGLPNVSTVGRLAIAGFVSPAAVITGYLKYGQQASIDPQINVHLFLLFGAVIPAVLLIDIIQMRRHSEWSPSVLYLIGAMLLWFLTLPVYLYRRQKVM